MRTWRARLVLAATLVGFLALAARVAVTLVEPDLLEQKLAGAQRYLYYRITETSGPTFQLEPGSSSLRLVTHAVVPGGQSYDAARELEYGVRVRIDAGGKTWQREVYTRSRQSKARFVPGAPAMWLDENTFVPESTLQLTDDRVLAIALPADLVAKNATARVTLLGDLREGYVRAYSPMPRDHVSRRVRDLTDRERGRIAAQVSYVPFDRLHEPAELAELRFVEKRLSAEGEEGRDYQTRTLFTTGFRLRTSTTVERGLLVTAMRGAAINVVGPATIEIAIARPATFAADPGTLDVALVGETPSSPETIPLPGAGATSKHVLDVPAGVFTLTLHATAPARVELASTTAAALGGGALGPDEQSIGMYAADPAGPPVVVAIDGPPDLLSRVLRIDVRALASTPVTDSSATRALARWPGGTVTPIPSPAAATQPVRSTITVETLDEGGQVLGASVLAFESVPSRFEIAKLPGRLAASVCEPASLRYVAEPRGTRVRIKTSHPALVQIQTPYTLSPPPDVLEPPYDAVVPKATRWRYARFLERGWLALRPHNHDALGAAVLVAQARLEPRDEPPVIDGRGVAIAPERDGGRSSTTVIERVAPADVADFIAHWDTGRYTRLVPNQRVELDLGRLPSRPTIRYRALDDAAIGAKVEVEIDGEVVDRDDFAAARGSLRLPSGLSGRRAIVVRTDASVELLIDRPPTGGGAELYALRSVIAVGAKARLKVKKTALRQNVNIVLYTKDRAGAANVRITVDGGAPARVSGVALAHWTLADRTLPLPPSDRPATLGFADRTGGALHARHLAIALGDDVPPGEHAIELSVSGTDVWGRFFVLDEAPAAPRALQWREVVE